MSNYVASDDLHNALSVLYLTSAHLRLVSRAKVIENQELIEDQSLPVDASPTALSPGYIDDSNLKEDPEEDPVNYPANGGDNDDDMSSNDDDDDDDIEKDKEDKEEEEHLAPVTDDLVPSS
nr:hypothetical protein [Tanacetum cinerariifolium]